MVNENRIVPVTRTDLVTLFCTAYNMSHENAIRIAEVVDGAPAFPQDIAANDVFIAAEPIKGIQEPPEAPFFFLPAYDFEIEGTEFADASGNKFVPNPGVLCTLQGAAIKEVATGILYAPAMP